MSAVYTLAELRALGAIDLMGQQLAHALGAMVTPAPPAEVGLAIALLSRQVGHGHVCLDLADLCADPPRLQHADGVRRLPLPPLEGWRRLLEASPLVEPVPDPPTESAPGPAAPLVLSGDRLYLRRYFDHERALCAALRGRVDRTLAVDERWLEGALARLFPTPAVAAGTRMGGEVGQLSLDFVALQSTVPDAAAAERAIGAEEDLQRVACAQALHRSLFVISGGPGTGKTSTVVKLLSLIVERAFLRGQPAPRMHLLAPTGKAAARLSESIAGARAQLDVSEAVRGAIPAAASTIHRALGSRGRRGPGFVHDVHTPLVADLVLVDEASMVDLALMRRLFDAIPPHAQVVLLGDRNQLASVEAGAVLGDLCGAGLPAALRRGRPMADAVVHLTRSYRYAQGSGIQRLADAIQAGDADAVLSLLADTALPDIALRTGDFTQGLSPALRDDALEGYRAYLEACAPAARLDALDGFRLLCAHRHGAHGVEEINRRVAEALHRAGLLGGVEGHYAGRPIMITQNDYQARLFNGDVGVLSPPATGEGGLRCYFADGGAEPRSIAASRLPPHETVFAMSIHKSQGSEFDAVAIVLPPAGSALLSRELLYTAVTRARHRVVIHAAPEAVAEAVATEVKRASGLRDALWG